MKVRTSELTAAALNWAVAQCEGVEVDENQEPIWFADTEDYNTAPRIPYNPSSDWAQGGPIIEREGIMLNEGTDSTNRIKASIESDEDEQYLVTQFGPTSLMAAMRCYVASKLGDEVEVPDGLM